MYAVIMKEVGQLCAAPAPEKESYKNLLKPTRFTRMDRSNGDVTCFKCQSSVRFTGQAPAYG